MVLRVRADVAVRGDGTVLHLVARSKLGPSFLSKQKIVYAINVVISSSDPFQAPGDEPEDRQPEAEPRDAGKDDPRDEGRPRRHGGQVRGHADGDQGPEGRRQRAEQDEGRGGQGGGLKKNNNAAVDSA